MKKRTCVSIDMIIDVVRRWVICWIAAHVRFTLALVHAHIVDVHLIGESQR